MRVVAALRGLIQWVQLYTEAQINFRDLTPYLTYDFMAHGQIYNNEVTVCLLISYFLTDKKNLEKF